MLERSGTPTTFARQAALTHVLYAADQRRPVEVWANEEAGLVRWLTRRLSYDAHVPDLNPLGFALVGGRLVAGNEKPTALVMYENAEKQRLTLQWRVTNEHGGESGETSFRYSLENGVGVFYWIEDQCAYALSGPLDRAQLLAVARVVYGQLATPSKPAPAAPPADGSVPKTAPEQPRVAGLGAGAGLRRPAMAFATGSPTVGLGRVRSVSHSPGMRDNPSIASSGHPMVQAPPLVVYVHFIAALAAMAIGAVQLARPKGTAGHRVIGWSWAALMMVVVLARCGSPRSSRSPGSTCSRCS